MTLTIKVAREGRLREEAMRRGVPAEKLASAIDDQSLQIRLQQLEREYEERNARQRAKP
jgi:hypothetical protein